MFSFCATPEYMIDIASGNTKMPSMHYHASYELYYLEAGSREYFVDDKLFSVCAGDFVLIPPGKLHRTGGEYGKRILVGFTTQFLERVYTPETARRLTKCFDHLKVTPSQNQQRNCIELLKKLTVCNDETESALLLGLMLMELEKCSEEVIEEDCISAIVAYINQNYGDISTISQIADHFYISKFHLCRIFKNAMKVTVIEYLNQIRIKNACQILGFSRKGNEEIAELCGFHSVAYFSSVFKKITGKTPSEYRKENYVSDR